MVELNPNIPVLDVKKIIDLDWGADWLVDRLFFWLYATARNVKNTRQCSKDGQTIKVTP